MNDQALVVREPEHAEHPAIVKAPITPAQAKIDAVANLTMSAYAKASTLQLTPEEIAALQADFPDEAFQPGAAGKENLIYIEHAHLRDRLNQVFGPGQWSIVPRNRWAEDFTTGTGKDASRVYVEAMLCIRGCFVAEAVGDMVYYKNNDSQNYGDAVEGAKTAALRRCAKELGIGLQAWKKDWCLGWWERRKGNRRTDSVNSNARQTKPAQTQKPPSDQSSPAKATEKTRAWFLAEMRKRFDNNVLYQWACNYPESHPFLIDSVETLEDWKLEQVPTNRTDLEVLVEQCAQATGAEPRAQKASGSPQERPSATPDESGAENASQEAQEAPESGLGASETPQEGLATITGKLEAVSVKEGRSAKGKWTRYGLKVGETWANTFSDTLGKLAQGDKGRMVTIHYKAGERGNDLVSIERAK